MYDQIVKFIKSSALLAAVLATVASANANLVVNGGFEMSAPGTYYVGSTAVTGWTIVGTPGQNVYVAPDNYLGLFSTQSLDLSGYSDQVGQGVEQTLNNAEGKYVLSVDIATGGYGASAVDVLIDGQLVGSNISSVTAKNYQFTFNSGGDSTIEFLTVGQGWVNHIDNVNVSTATPAPGPMAVIGINALGLIWRRKRAR
jgi:hypothetical protein